MKRTKRTLSVSKETLRKLSNRELGHARGGGTNNCGGGGGGGKDDDVERVKGNAYVRAGDSNCCNRG